MAENSHISWCHNTANFWWGCVKVSNGPKGLCENCYAERDSTRYGFNIFGTESRRRFIKSAEVNLIKWNGEAGISGDDTRVFSMSMGDLFEILPQGHPDAEEMCRVRQRAFDLLEATIHLHHLILTKRIANVRKLVPARWLREWPRHIRLGISVGTQKEADRDIPRLLQYDAPNFLSMEPLMEEVSISRWLDQIGWCITGGESGPHARPALFDWYRRLRDECVNAGVPYHFKQIGEWLDLDTADQADNYPGRKMIVAHGHRFVWLGKKEAGRELDSREWNECPVSGESRRI